MFCLNRQTLPWTLKCRVEKHRRSKKLNVLFCVSVVCVTKQPATPQINSAPIWFMPVVSSASQPSCCCTEDWEKHLRGTQRPQRGRQMVWISDRTLVSFVQGPPGGARDPGAAASEGPRLFLKVPDHGSCRWCCGKCQHFMISEWPDVGLLDQQILIITNEDWNLNWDGFRLRERNKSIHQMFCFDTLQYIHVFDARHRCEV